MNRFGTVSLRLRTLALLAFGLGAIGCATTPTPPPAFTFDEYRIGAPDQLSVKVLPEPLIEEVSVVRPDGKITVQLIGDVQASGRTPNEVAKDIEGKIGRFKRGARVTVSVLSAQSSTITILGEVRRPGTFLLAKHTRIAEALGTASGPTLFANADSITIVRGAGENVQIIPVDLDAIRSGNLSTNVLIQGGDIVYVPPTILAKIGYGMQALLFPLQPLLGLARSIGGGLIGASF